MSTAARVISGSAVSWAQIAVTMLTQMALVPLYLSHWNVVTYGIWLAIWTLAGVMMTLDYGHQDFLAYEFLRLGHDRKQLSKCLWSGVGAGIAISLFQVVMIFGILQTGILPFFLGKADVTDPGLVRAAGIILLVQGSLWVVSIHVTGLFFRALAPFGYFPRMAWWNLINSILTAVAPVTAVMLGADLLGAGMVSCATTLLISVPMYWDLLRLLRKEEIHFSSPSLQLGYRNFVRSLAISGKGILENARQQGARLVLAPLAGAAGLTAFSTMRTGTNVALQGLNTIINPLMPELMRFLHQRDQVRSEAAFGTVWFVLVAMLAPAIVVLQASVQPFYVLWTRGQVPFDPLLFAVLSLSVLVYAVAQPAIAVVKGNNLLKAQLVLSALAALVVVGGIGALVPLMGLRGAGIALLAAEIVALAGYQVVAQRWLRANELVWPRQHFQIASASVWLAAAAMGMMVVLPQAKWIILAGSLLLLYANLWRYWQVLPAIATQHAMRILSKLPGLKGLHASSKT